MHSVLDPGIRLSISLMAFVPLGSLQPAKGHSPHIALQHYVVIRCPGEREAQHTPGKSSPDLVEVRVEQVTQGMLPRGHDL